MKVSEFNFNLPEELIAQEALADRAASRLLVLARNGEGEPAQSHVKDIGQFLRAGDLLVVNNSRVLPARLLSDKFECFLLKRLSADTWQALIRPGKKASAGDVLEFERDGSVLTVRVEEKYPDGKVRVKLIDPAKPGCHDGVEELLRRVGHMPLPPYIKRADTLADQERYQTVYSKRSGSVAAPTAGLHFTPELISSLKEQGIGFAEVTLHVGYGTFKPVRAENVEEHAVDPENYEISEETARQINSALAEGRRVIAVGTTTTRVLEYCARENRGQIRAGAGSADIFIYPGFRFQVISGLVTNFHLPKSSLLMLVCGFAGRERVLRAYDYAVKNRFRFYSYGDAMLIV